MNKTAKCYIVNNDSVEIVHMPKDAAYYKLYRDKRRKEGNPVPPSRNRGTRGGHKSKWDSMRYICWDGEGIGNGKNHRYVLLANSLGESIHNLQGLKTTQCFDFILDIEQRYPNRTHVIFAGDYDANMMFVDIPIEKLREIHQNKNDFGTYWNGYYIKYTKRKVLWIKKVLEWDIKGPKKVLSVNIWDIWGNFQSTFVDAIRDYLGEDYVDYETIANMKAKRSDFKARDFEKIKSYCFMELLALDKIMLKFHNAVDDAGLGPLQRYDGAGALASRALSKFKVKTMMNQDKDIEILPYTYAGGRNEMIKWGNYEGTVYGYDINSAYPSAMERLPCMAHGNWIRRDRNSFTGRLNGKKVSPKYAIYNIEWKYPPNKPFYPFFWRNNNGNVLFPPEGLGWYWEPEVIAAFENIEWYNENREGYPKAYIKILDCWEYVPECNHKPFEWVPELYNLRKKWKNEGLRAHYILKLAINSLYGKQVQQIGAKVHNGKLQKPAYHQLSWGSYITSYTRARIYNAGMERPDSVIFMATDGIYTTEELNRLPISDKLGEWEQSIYSGCTAIQYGVYFLKGNLSEGNSEWKAFRRGYDKDAITRSDILRSWELGIESIEVPLTRFITLGSAMVSDKYLDHWRQWYKMDRKLILHPVGKRYIEEYENCRPYERLEESFANYAFPGGMSSPFKLRLDGELWAHIDGVNEQIVIDEMEIDA